MSDSVSSVGYTFEPVDTEAEGTLLFCGPAASDLPLCPNCRVPFTQMLRIATSDDRWDLTTVSAPYVDLIYCWRCNVAQGPFFYQIASDGRLEILRYKLGTQGADFPYEDYPSSFPLALVLPERMSDDLQDSLHRLNELERRGLPTDEYRQSFKDWMTRFDVRHQIGGEPYRYDPTWITDCLRCKNKMAFLAAIADSNTSPRGFADNCGVHVLFFFCRACSVVGAIHEVD